MKLIPQILSIAVLGFLAELILPWYSVAFVAFVMGYFLYSEGNFAGGFVGVMLLWAVQLFFVLHNAATDLAQKVAVIFPFKEKWVLIAVTLLIGGLVGGMSALTGALLKGKKRSSNRYSY